MSGSRVLSASSRERSKATYELNLYVFPRESRDAPHFVKQATAWLTESGIVSGFFDEGLGWLAPGEKASLLFEGADPGAPGFEYLIVRDEEAPEFVPNAHMGRFGARCPSCGTLLDDVIHDYLERQGAGLIRDVRREPFRCCGCNLLIPPSALKCEIQTGVTPCYLNFCHVDSDVLSAAAVEELERRVGGALRQVCERL